MADGERLPRSHQALAPASLAAVADRLRDTLQAGEPAQTKALLRLLIKELRVNSRSEILPTYRIVTPEVCATPSSVERTGIEPVTSALQRAPTVHARARRWHEAAPETISRPWRCTRVHRRSRER